MYEDLLKAISPHKDAGHDSGYNKVGEHTGQICVNTSTHAPGLCNARILPQISNVRQTILIKFFGTYQRAATRAAGQSSPPAQMYLSANPSQHPPHQLRRRSHQLGMAEQQALLASLLRICACPYLLQGLQRSSTSP